MRSKPGSLDVLRGPVERERGGDLGTHPPQAASRGHPFPYRSSPSRGEGEEKGILPFFTALPPPRWRQR
ncbi:hypothetical protein AV530_016537 [Patagioenas fasciata monilis]|uniref:Uncharacterized protein n=1 Tax=Patagioenas fasciata monilis TaxID=372326 RepID=A0A1V4J2R7_PATFA|nr:hypothetical protein AV530_016537 [Patagioenas fasciata monilis]